MLHAPEEAASSSGDRTTETPFLGDASISLVADEKIRLACSTREYTETVDDIDLLSSGSISPDLGDMWRQGCPKSQEWEGELELDSADEDDEAGNAGSADEIEDEGLKDYLKQVIETTSDGDPIVGFGSRLPLFSRCP